MHILYILYDLRQTEIDHIQEHIYMYIDKTLINFGKLKYKIKADKWYVLYMVLYHVNGINFQQFLSDPAHLLIL